MERQRAKRGSIAERILIPIDAALLATLRRVAAVDGISMSEWVRAAVRERLSRATTAATGE